MEYEPVYWSVEHKNSINNEIINSEKWKINNRGTISIRSRNSDYSCRSPDIVLSVFNQTGKAVRFVIDAKYSRKELVFKDYPPKLALKYLHRIHDKKSGKSANIGLMIIHPEHQDIVRFFHHDNYNIFSNKPILPSIISYGIQPKVSHPLNFDLEKVINRIIELMLGDISKT